MISPPKKGQRRGSGGCPLAVISLQLSECLLYDSCVVSHSAEDVHLCVFHGAEDPPDSADGFGITYPLDLDVVEEVCHLVQDHPNPRYVLREQVAPFSIKRPPPPRSSRNTCLGVGVWDTVSQNNRQNFVNRRCKLFSTPIQFLQKRII